MQQINVRGVVLEHNLDEVVEALRVVPRVVAFEMRNVVGRSFGRWNRAMKASPTKVGRELAKRGAFTYKLSPSDAEYKQRRNESLDRVWGRFRSESQVVLAHEFGAHVRPKAGKYLTVPVGKYRKIPRAERSKQGLAPEQLSPIVRRRRGQSVIGLGVPTGQTLRSGEPKLDLVYVLRRSVTLKATLGMLSTWDRLQPDRDEILAEAVGRIAAAVFALRSRRAT